MAHGITTGVLRSLPWDRLAREVRHGCEAVAKKLPGIVVLLSFRKQAKFRFRKHFDS